MVGRELSPSDFVDLIVLIAEMYSRGISPQELRVRLHDHQIDFSMEEFVNALNRSLADGKIIVRFQIERQSEILLPRFCAIKK